MPVRSRAKRGQFGARQTMRGRPASSGVAVGLNLKCVCAPPLARELFREGREAGNGTISGLSCLAHRTPFEMVVPPGRQILGTYEVNASLTL